MLFYSLFIAILPLSQTACPKFKNGKYFIYNIACSCAQMLCAILCDQEKTRSALYMQCYVFAHSSRVIGCTHDYSLGAWVSYYVAHEAYNHRKPLLNTFSGSISSNIWTAIPYCKDAVFNLKSLKLLWTLARIDVTHEDEEVEMHWLLISFFWISSDSDVE